MVADDSVERAERLYSELLADMADRIDAAATFVSVPGSWPLARAAAGELRGVLELLILSGLLTNRARIEEAETALAGLNRKRALELVRGVNEDWWPKPVVTYPDHINYRVGDDWLTETQWDAYYSKTSGVLHIRNPFTREAPRLDNTIRWLTELVNLSRALLSAHLVYYDETTFLLGQIGPPDQLPRVWVNRFVPPERLAGAQHEQSAGS